MFREGWLDKSLKRIKKLIPKSVFDLFAPTYHMALAYAGAVMYGFPSRSMKVIGVTGTKGKSTTVFLITKILEGAGEPVAAIGSLGFKIKDKEWPNTLKMTMPGRFKLQKFLAEAKSAGCKYAVLEVTSEGIRQKRHIGINFDCAVFTNLHKEHIESHGSFENYYKAKQELFAVTKNIHVLNSDDSNLKLFSDFPSRHKIFYGLKAGDMRVSDLKAGFEGTSFEIYGTLFSTKLAGQFNILNCLAALSVGAMYGIELGKMKPALESVKFIPGRMEFIQREPFNVVVDYAHTPESLEAVYKTLKNNIQNDGKKLICVLGAAGGGRDKWKRPEFGRIASEYCDEIILTNEDPYDENPKTILEEIAFGISSSPKFKNLKVSKILDRREAIKNALMSAKKGDTVIITGKGSEIFMAVTGGKKLPWSDKDISMEFLNK